MKVITLNYSPSGWSDRGHGDVDEKYEITPSAELGAGFRAYLSKADRALSRSG